MYTYDKSNMYTKTQSVSQNLQSNGKSKKRKIMKKKITDVWSDVKKSMVSPKEENFMKKQKRKLSKIKPIKKQK